MSPLQARIIIALKHMRKQYACSQFELELEAGFTPGTISRIENGRVNPTKETLLRIAHALNLCIEEQIKLFGLIEVTNKSSDQTE